MGSNRIHAWCICLTVFLFALCTGCIIIPVDFHTSESRHNVKEEVMDSLQPGTTSKEDVFVMLGEPDEVSFDGNCLTYRWEKVKAVWVVGGGYSAAGGTIDRMYGLILTFDDHGLLIRKELTKQFVGRQ